MLYCGMDWCTLHNWTEADKIVTGHVTVRLADITIAVHSDTYILRPAMSTNSLINDHAGFQSLWRTQCPH